MHLLLRSSAGCARLQRTLQSCSMNTTLLWAAGGERQKPVDVISHKDKMRQWFQVHWACSWPGISFTCSSFASIMLPHACAVRHECVRVKVYAISFSCLHDSCIMTSCKGSHVGQCVPVALPNWQLGVPHHLLYDDQPHAFRQEAKLAARKKTHADREQGAVHPKASDESCLMVLLNNLTETCRAKSVFSSSVLFDLRCI